MVLTVFAVFSPNQKIAVGAAGEIERLCSGGRDRILMRDGRHGCQGDGSKTRNKTAGRRH